MTWLFQALPLASTLTVSDASEALSTELSTAAAGSLGVDISLALSGSVSTSESGNFIPELFGLEILSAQGDFTNSRSVRLRSRKSSSGTADAVLLGSAAQALASTVTPVKSVLLGGSGFTASQQTIPTKTVARLLTGEVRTMTPGSVSVSSALDTTVGPVLWGSDLTSGPATGNSDTSYGQVADVNGCYVSVWGVNLGATQGTSTITCCGAAVTVVPYWGSAVPPWSPANLVNGYQNWQMIIFQVPAAAPSGLGQIVVTVGGVVSKTVVTTYSATTGFTRVVQDGLPFTVRTGRIRFAKTTGSDAADGLWNTPFATIKRLKDFLTTPGDIGYACNGVNQLTEDGSTGMYLNVAVTLDGTETAPIALAAYPGADCTIGVLNVTGAGKTHARVYAQWRTFAKFKFHGGTQSTLQINPGDNIGNAGFCDGIRIVGCNIQAPYGSASDGTLLFRAANKRRVLCNEFTNISTNSGYNQQYHVIYSAGLREVGLSAQAPDEIDHEYAYNYFHDNLADTAMQLYNYSNVPASNLAALVKGYNIHHNVIIDQAGDGVKCSEHGSFNDLHSNIIMRAGSAAVDVRNGTVSWNIYSNTLIDNGERGDALNGRGAFNWSSSGSGTFNIKNNVIVQTNGQPYIATETGAASLIRVANNNLWYGNGAPPSFDTDPLNVDPQFVNFTTEPFDLRLESTSPALDAGTDLSAVVKFDIDGVPRPQGDVFDIGPYESAYDTSALGQLAGTMAVGDWAQLTGVANTSLYQDSYLGGVSHILPYVNKCPYDPVLRRVWTGGSDDPSQKRRIVYYDLATNAAVLVDENSVAAQNHGSCTPSIDVVNRKFYIGMYDGSGVRSYNLDVNGLQTYTSLGTKPWGNAGGVHAMAYFPERQSLFYVGADRIWERPDATGTWVFFAWFTTAIGRVCHYSPYHQCLLVGGGTTSGNVLRRIDANGTITAINSATVPTTVDMPRNHFIDDPTTGLFHLIQNASAGGRRWTFDPIADIWTDIGVTTVPTILKTAASTPANTKICAVACVIPEAKVHLWICGHQQGVGASIEFWLYKYA